MNHMSENEVSDFRTSMSLDGPYWDKLGHFFKAFGDATRLRILTALSESSLCVSDLCALLDMTPSAISHQLKGLKLQRLITSTKAGQHVIYSLDDDHIEQILSIGNQHLAELEK